MGVPAFYRWLSRKYPKCIHDCKEDKPQMINGEYVPVDTSQPNPNGEEFDNLYLDMNGIIHPASHPEDRPPPTTEDDMYLAIAEYLERVFAAIRPRKVLYMAIDGVAPRAKMNQQRSRRFKSAKEREDKEAAREKLLNEWRAEGRELPPDKGPEFDSNVITPGTPFMDRLAAYLRTFVHHKMDTDPGWRNIKVVFSDANVPGEGEHKIMEYIRLQRAQPDYNPNTRHVIHGLDADLIMLALATHEPHFTILREEVFQRNKEVLNIEEQVKSALEAEAATNGVEGNADDISDADGAAYAKPFQCLRVNVLREYLDKEMSVADYSCVGGYDLERVIDDFIFMCFFVGNDFLPHLPSMEIREGAIDTIMELYRVDFGKFGGYLTQNGEVDLGRAEMLMAGIAEVENVILQRRREKDLKDQQKVEDIANKKTTQKHLELIRQCTQGAHVAPVDHVTAASRREARVSDLRFDANVDNVTAADFRIKNFGVGGKRVLRGDVREDDARLLHLLDKIRAFHDDDRPNRRADLELRGLRGRERFTAHCYCEELGLTHDSAGTEPNRYILVGRPDAEDENDDDVIVADAFSAALKERVRSNNKIDNPTDDVQLGSQGWYGRYYQQKFPPNVDQRHVVKSYVEGLVWVLRYYYQGCSSWSWFYPYHYAPFARDFTNLQALDIVLPPGQPFSPFEQLMAVFPPASSHALPNAFARLMTDPDSPIAEYYPTEFEQDLNGKKFMWQAVVLLPFINEERLLTALRPLRDTLTPEEKRRNERGADRLFVHQSHPAALQMSQLGNGGANDGSRPAPPAPTTNGADEIETAEQTGADEDKVDLNDLAAQCLQAELAGDPEEERRLKQQLAAARRQQAAEQPAPVSFDADGAGFARENFGHTQALARISAFQRASWEQKLEKSPVGTEVLDPRSTGGLSGLVALDADGPQLGELVPRFDFHGRETDSRYLLTAFVNHVLRALYWVPPYTLHKPMLLPGLNPPAAELGDHDLPVGQRFERVPRERQLDVGASRRMIVHGMGGNFPRTSFHRGRGGKRGPHDRGYGGEGEGQGPSHEYNRGYGRGRGQGHGWGRGRGEGHGHGQGPSYPGPMPSRGGQYAPPMGTGQPGGSYMSRGEPLQQRPHYAPPAPQSGYMPGGHAQIGPQYGRPAAPPPQAYGQRPPGPSGPVMPQFAGMPAGRAPPRGPPAPYQPPSYQGPPIRGGYLPPYAAGRMPPQQQQQQQPYRR